MRSYRLLFVAVSVVLALHAVHAQPRFLSRLLESNCQCDCCYVIGTRSRTECIPPTATSFSVSSCSLCDVDTCAKRYPTACAQVSSIATATCIKREGWMLRLVPVTFIAIVVCLVLYGLCVRKFDGYHDDNLVHDSRPRVLERASYHTFAAIQPPNPSFDAASRPLLSTIVEEQDEHDAAAPPSDQLSSSHPSEQQPSPSIEFVNAANALEQASLQTPNACPSQTAGQQHVAAHHQSHLYIESTRELSYSIHTSSGHAVLPINTDSPNHRQNLNVQPSPTKQAASDSPQQLYANVSDSHLKQATPPLEAALVEQFHIAAYAKQSRHPARVGNTEQVCDAPSEQAIIQIDHTFVAVEGHNMRPRVDTKQVQDQAVSPQKTEVQPETEPDLLKPDEAAETTLATVQESKLCASEATLPGADVKQSDHSPGSPHVVQDRRALDSAPAFASGPDQTATEPVHNSAAAKIEVLGHVSPGSEFLDNGTNRLDAVTEGVAQDGKASQATESVSKTTSSVQAASITVSSDVEWDPTTLDGVEPAVTDYDSGLPGIDAQGTGVTEGDEETKDVRSVKSDPVEVLHVCESIPFHSVGNKDVLRQSNTEVEANAICFALKSKNPVSAEDSEPVPLLEIQQRGEQVENLNVGVEAVNSTEYSEDASNGPHLEGIDQEESAPATRLHVIPEPMDQEESPSLTGIDDATEKSAADEGATTDVEKNEGDEEIPSSFVSGRGERDVPVVGEGRHEEIIEIDSIAIGSTSNDIRAQSEEVVLTEALSQAEHINAVNPPTDIDIVYAVETQQNDLEPTTSIRAVSALPELAGFTSGRHPDEGKQDITEDVGKSYLHESLGDGDGSMRQAESPMSRVGTAVDAESSVTVTGFEEVEIVVDSPGEIEQRNKTGNQNEIERELIDGFEDRNGDLQQGDEKLVLDTIETDIVEDCSETRTAAAEAETEAQQEDQDTSSTATRSATAGKFHEPNTSKHENYTHTEEQTQEERIDCDVKEPVPTTAFSVAQHNAGLLDTPVDESSPLPDSVNRQETTSDANVGELTDPIRNIIHAQTTPGLDNPNFIQ